LISADRTKVLAAPSTSVAGIRLFELLPAHPIVTVGSAVKLLESTKPTAAKAVAALVAAGLLVETTGRRRDRSYSYQAYLNCLRSGTEPE
jgi:Fic family protein